MKELSKLLVQSRLPIRRTQQAQTQVQTQQTQQPVQPNRPVNVEVRPQPQHGQQGKPQGTGSVYASLDSWKTDEIDPSEIISREEFERVIRPGRKSVPERKKRGVCLSLSVSPEESDLLRRYCATLNLSFSEWARSALFESMGRKVPKRVTNK